MWMLISASGSLQSRRKMVRTTLLPRKRVLRLEVPEPLYIPNILVNGPGRRLAQTCVTWRPMMEQCKNLFESRTYYGFLCPTQLLPQRLNETVFEESLQAKYQEQGYGVARVFRITTSE